MSGYNPRDDLDQENNPDLFEQLLDALDTQDNAKPKASRSARSKGEFFRKIEKLREEKNLRDNLSDYDWDD